MRLIFGEKYIFYAKTKKLKGFIVLVRVIVTRSYMLGDDASDPHRTIQSGVRCDTQILDMSDQWSFIG